MKITRAGSTPSRPGPTEWFTGQVRMDPIFAADPPGRATGTLVTFEPGARTNWHTHPAGQTLMVQSGRGRVQREGGPVEDVFPGDVVFFAAGERHWHGASPLTAMCHIAIQESVDGSTVTWQGPVTDKEYGT